MELYRLLDKIGRGQRLSESELADLRLQTRALEEAKDLVKGWVTLGTGLPIFQMPMETIFSEILAENKSTLTISIPNKFNHLLIMGAGRTNGAGTNSDFLLCQYNGDTGNNYINQKLYAVATVLTGERNTSQDDNIIGLLAQGGRPAGDVGSFFYFIPHYNNSTLNKNVLTFASPAYGSFYAFGSNWDSLNAIESIKFYSGTDDIAAGSILSIYGIT